VEGFGPVSAHQARLLRPTAELQAVWVDADTGIPLGVDPTVHPPVGEPDWDDPAQISLAAETVRQRLRAMIRPTTIEDRAEPGRFPSAGLARLVRIRDLRCTGPGCPRHAADCEIDHLEEVAKGGLTAIWLLALKSPRCHHARHTGWTATRDETDGSTTWTSPLGGHYRRRSPWRPPPRITKPLPPASLDRPDGGKQRTFGIDPEEPASPDERDTRESPDEPGEPIGPIEQPTPGNDANPAPWKTALDHLREIQTDRAEHGEEPTDPADRPNWGRPWPTDDPPPF
jgi:hypothetical protein